mmetsp:Transcript_15167/g.21210  ORF Transcript_15167/g.21210 Transcript_15167/m.21210 type:complete len:289 (-) Transcript_15167:155-1021(-)|eukprot:jgi/Bigna1/91404/estExt_fgenesh1_pg.C_1000004
MGASLNSSSTPPTWRKMLFSEEDSDVHIVCMDSEEKEPETIYAHRCVLSAGNPFFHQKLRRLPRNKPVEWRFCESAGIMRGVLRYVYLGDPRFLENYKPSWQVFRATCKFELEGLQEQAERLAASAVTLETLKASVLVLDNYPGKGYLREACANFIRRHSLPVLLSHANSDNSVLKVADTHPELWKNLVLTAMGKVLPEQKADRRRRRPREQNDVPDVVEEQREDVSDILHGDAKSNQVQQNNQHPAKRSRIESKETVLESSSDVDVDNDENQEPDHSEKDENQQPES